MLADNISVELENLILSHDVKFYENKRRGRCQYFFDKLNFCMNNFVDDDTIYLVEDDYLHIGECHDLINEGLEYAEYVTLYDHPDKYIQCSFLNPEVTNIGEQTIVFRTKSSHWKYTNSTTGTFACKKHILKHDYECWKNSYTECPTGWWDYLAFKHLRATKNRKIASSLPGKSSHMASPEGMSPYHHD